MFPAGLNRFWQRISKSLLQIDANTVEQRNGTEAQKFRVYNAYKDGANYQRGFMRWVSSSELEIGTESSGVYANPSTSLIIRAGGYGFKLITNYGDELVTSNQGICILRRTLSLGSGQDQYSGGSIEGVSGAGLPSSIKSNAGGNWRVWLVGSNGVAGYPAANNAMNGTGAAVYCGYGVTPSTAGNGGNGGTFDVWLNSGAPKNTSGTDGVVGMLRVINADTSLATFTVTKTGTVTLESLISTGSISTGVTLVKTTNFTVSASDGLIQIDSTSGAITGTLETAVGHTRIHAFKKVAGVNLVTIDGNASETIDGATSITLTDRCILQSNGTEWKQIA